MLEEDEDVQKEKEYFVYVDSLADSAVMMGLRCWVLKDAYWQTKWRLTENVKYALEMPV